MVVVAEGAGQHLIGHAPGRDASGNVRYNDVGLYLKRTLLSELKHSQHEGCEIKLIDPSYLIRSAPANTEDRILCTQLAIAGNAKISKLMTPLITLITLMTFVILIIPCH